MKAFNQIIDQINMRRQRDRETFEEQDGDLCVLCHAYGSDKRSLIVDCLYDVTEAVPEALDIYEIDFSGHKKGFYLRICKTCRGKFLGHLQQWRAERIAQRTMPKDHDGYEIEAEYLDEYAPARIQGVTVYLPCEEYERYKKESGK